MISNDLSALNALRRLQFRGPATICIFSNLQQFAGDEMPQSCRPQDNRYVAASIAALGMFEGWRGAVVASCI
jgi:hypothetical protein